MCVLQNLALSTCITSIFCTCSLYYFIIILLCTCMYECVDYSSLRLVFTVFSSTIKKVSSSSSSCAVHISVAIDMRTLLDRNNFCSRTNGQVAARRKALL